MTGNDLQITVKRNGHLIAAFVYRCDAELYALRESERYIRDQFDVRDKDGKGSLISRGTFGPVPRLGTVSQTFSQT